MHNPDSFVNRSTCRSPVYATFTEALDGAASIRAYDAQQRFCQLNEHQVALVQQAAYAGLRLPDLLACRPSCQESGAGIVFFYCESDVLRSCQLNWQSTLTRCSWKCTDTDALPAELCIQTYACDPGASQTPSPPWSPRPLAFHLSRPTDAVLTGVRKQTYS